MERKSFIKSILAAIIAPSIGIKRKICSIAFPVDRSALARAMVAPIMRERSYQSIGRKLLMVDSLSNGTLDRYERDVRQTAYIINEEDKSINFTTKA